MHEYEIWSGRRCVEVIEAPSYAAARAYATEVYGFPAHVAPVRPRLR